MREINIVVVPGVMLADLAGIGDTFRLAVELGASYDVRYVGPVGTAESSVGLSLSGIARLPTSVSVDCTVVIPGATHYETDYERPQANEAAAWLAETITPGVRLCTVCSGAFLAAKAGLLRGKTCTTHHHLTDELALCSPSSNVLQNRIFVRDGDTYTSAGATTGIDLVLQLISDDEGPELSLEVARKLVIYFRRSGADPQLSTWLLHRNHLHTAVHRAQDAVIRNPSLPWSLPDLARVACTSPRNLARLFQTHAGISPHTYVRRVRTAAAKEIVGSSHHSMEAVAEMVGFSSAEQMRRAWQQFEGANPTGRRNSVTVDSAARREKV
jgi:transcriptional regulator GlxA family with amidase domain